MGEHVAAGDFEIWTELVGEVPDVLLIAAGTPSSRGSSSSTARRPPPPDRHRGAGRTAMPEGRVSVEAMADDAAGVLRALDIRSAHVAGFSGASIVSQELALRHPDSVRSLVLQSTRPVMDPYLRSWLLFVRRLVEVAPSERAFLEGVLPRHLHRRGRTTTGPSTNSSEQVLAFPDNQTTEDLQH
jgi:3-oxoadipate enol-lactonase